MSVTTIRRAGQPDPASEVAADWVLRQEGGELNASDRRRLEDWLAESPVNVEAYHAAMWALDAAARNSGEPELMAMREAALAARGPRRSWPGLAAAGAVAASLLGLWAFLAQPELVTRTIVPTSAVQTAEAPGVYRTSVGERLAVTLPDGSVATLDTDSRIRVDYSTRERGVHLVRGQALFEVASGKPLPFQVHAGGQVITAIGTVFNVRLERDSVKVSLVEGTIRVRANPDALAGLTSSAPARAMVLNAGESVEVRPRQPIAVKQEDVNRAAAWRHGRLVFNDTSLNDAVAEINRYTAQPIAIEDAEAGAHRVTGVFQSSDPERFSRAMTEVFPIEARRDADGSIALHSRER